MKRLFLDVYVQVMAIIACVIFFVTDSLIIKILSAIISLIYLIKIIINIKVGSNG